MKKLYNDVPFINKKKEQGTAELQSQVETLTSQLAQNANKLDHVATNIAQYPRQGGETDDTARIRRAIAALDDNDTLLLPEINGWYNITDTIVINKNINFICKGKIQFSGTRDKVALQFVGTTMRTIEINQIYDQVAVANPTLGWHGLENTAYVGVELVNLKQCKVYINDVRCFTTGVRVKASGGNGFWFNHLYITQISNSRYFLDINQDGVGSWVNGNYFYDTSFYAGTGAGSSYAPSTSEKYSIIQTLTNGNTYISNANYFYYQKYEVNGNYVGGLWTQIKLVKAIGWIFKDYRVELSGGNYQFANIDLTSSGSLDNKFYPSDSGGRSKFSYSNSFNNTQNITYSYPEIASLEGAKNYLILHEDGFKWRYRRYQDNYHTVKGLVRKPLASTSLTEEFGYEYTTTDLIAENGATIGAGSPIVIYLTNLSKGDTIIIEKTHSTGTLYSNWYKPFDTLDAFCTGGNIDGGKALAHNGFFDVGNNAQKQNVATVNDSFTVNSSNVKTVAILIAGTIDGFKIYSTNKNTVVKKTMNPTIFKTDGIYVRSIPSRILNGYFMPEDVVYNENTSTGQAIGWKLTLVTGTLTWVSIGTY